MQNLPQNYNSSQCITSSYLNYSYLTLHIILNNKSINQEYTVGDIKNKQ